MAHGMDVTPMITKKIGLDEVEQNIKLLQKDLNEVKITMIPE
jgi:(R,R)-butanediol dehydrogenase/meso-butanediol dehydrogenase/diacetyl reductase